MTEPTQLHALADGELAPQEAHALREALKTDPRAAAEVDAVLNLKDFLAKNAARTTDDEVWKGCVRRLDEIDRSRRAEGFVSRYAWALCGLMFLFIASGRTAMRNVHGDSAQTADFARVFGSQTPVSRQNRLEGKLYEAILGQVGANIDPKEIEFGQPAHGTIHDFPSVRVPARDSEGDLIVTRVGGLLDLQDMAPLPANPDVVFGVVDGDNGIAWHHNGETWIVSGARSVDELNEIATRLGAR